ncbi:leucine-rich_repeat protein [Hexamita inflata]|uniref:Leucine-rich repeat protein n=1 Tax=Hexamita inflata TaxID=28002 RepID=A0AA86QPC8_9EUKA|nr:leucine-rich repeat protein [Hexamita inflata]
MALTVQQLKQLYPNYATETDVILYNNFENLRILEQCINVVRLTCQNARIQRFDIQQNFEYLKELYISKSSIQNIDIYADLHVLHVTNCSLSVFDFATRYYNLMVLNISGNDLSLVTAKNILNSLVNLRELTANYCNLVDLSIFLDIAGNNQFLLLNKIDLSYNEPISLQGIQQCNNLTKMDVCHCGLRNLNYISETLSLQSLTACYNQLSDISMIGTLINLECLDLSFNYNLGSIASLLPLAKVTHLSFNQISAPSLNGVQNMFELVNLSAFTNLFTHVDELINATKLKNVNLSLSQIYNVSGLQNAKNIETLELNSNQLRSFVGMPQYSKLHTFLAHGNNHLKNCIGLGNQPYLQQLNLSKVESLEGIENLHALTSAQFNCNKLKSIQQLIHCTYIQELHVQSNELISLNGIQNLFNLTVIKADHNKLTSIAEISKLTMLKELVLNNNNIRSLDGIQKILSLQSLELGNNKISNLMHLQHLNQLNFLNLDKNNLSDIRQLLFLKEKQSLKTVWLAECQQLSVEGANKICQLPDFIQYVIQILPQIVSYCYESDYDRGGRYYSSVITAEERSLGKQLVISELTEQNLRELKEQ